MNSPTKAIFLSYASQDAEAARRICDALRAVGLDVWFDQSELRGGEAWDASIRRQIKECALFVPVISANTQARVEGYFRREWNLAAGRTLDMADDQAFLIPVVIDATIDITARVPEKFREVQWTRLPSGVAAATFAERVRRLLSGDTAVALPATPLRATQVPSPVSGAGPSAITYSPSIAVLPFVNMSRDEENEYFADGLSEELLNVLAKIRGLRVAARSSAFSFKGKGATVADVGRALNVATVLEGSVRKSGNRMRISVQLVKVVDGYQLWSETYDRTFDDIFAVQDDIAQSVLQELRTTLLGTAADPAAEEKAAEAIAEAVKGRSTDPEAHRLFLQARHFIDRNSRADVTRGIGYLQQALALEPDFALAWAELGRAHASAANWGWASAAEGFARAREAATRALELEPDLAEGHAGLGWVQMSNDRDWRGAEASYRRALELSPGNALVLQGLGMLSGNLGRFDEGIMLCRRSVEQDPLSPTCYFFLGLVYWTAGRPSEGEAALRKSLELAPQGAATHAWLAILLLTQGRSDEALAVALCEPEEWGRLFACAVIQHAAGGATEADAALRELEDKHGSEAAYQVAQARAARGEIDVAFAWLERAYDQRDAGIFWTLVDPLLETLHVDPRWLPFLAKLGLDP
jgi:TolB-like protein/Flp pilus assembly protein TadD